LPRRVPTQREEERWLLEITLAELLAPGNRPRESVELLSKLLKMPSGLTIAVLRASPNWHDTRGFAGFKAQLADLNNPAPQ